MSKLTSALTAGVVFFIVSNPIMYKLVDSLIGDALGRISNVGGCPTTWGLLVHSAVFATLTYYGVGL